MNKLILTLLLLCALAVSGCQDSTPAQQPQQNTTVTTQTQQQSFIVYRAAADGTEKLLPEKVTITANGKSLPENALIALVSTKPQDARYDDVLPIGTKLLSLKIAADGTAYADFSHELKDNRQGSYNELLLCYAITNTLTEFPEIKRVQLLIEGKKQVTLNGHMDIEDPLERNQSLL